MASTYVRSTRPIGKHEVIIKPIPNIDVTPHLTKIITSSLSNALTNTLKHAFQNIQTYQKVKSTRRYTKGLALRKLQEIRPRVENRMKYQALFLIRNFTPTETRATFDEINWHKDGNEKEPLDPNSQILRGIMYCPFKKPRRDSRQNIPKRRNRALPQKCIQSLITILSRVLAKSHAKGLSAIKTRCLLKNKPFLSAVSILLNLTDKKLIVGFSRIKYQSNRLYLKPRVEQVHKYKSLSLLKSEMNIESERREIIKQGIDKQKTYRNEIIITKERELRYEVLEMEEFFQYESDKLRADIMQQELYIENIFPANLHDTSAQAFNYFDLLQTIYLDLTENDKPLIPKRVFTKKYQIQEYDQTTQEVIVQNVRLWEQVDFYETYLGQDQPYDIKIEQALRLKQKQMLEQNTNMKKVVGFYVKEEYGKNLNRENRLIDNLRKELQEMETKLEQNKIEDVRVMFT